MVCTPGLGFDLLSRYAIQAEEQLFWTPKAFMFYVGVCFSLTVAAAIAPGDMSRRHAAIDVNDMHTCYAHAHPGV